MSTIIDAVLRLKDQFTPVLQNASKQLSEHAKTQKRVAKEIQSTGRSITELGAKIALISAPLEAAAMSGLKLHAQFAAGMEKVSTLVDKTTVSVKELSDGVRKVSDETGESVTDLAEAEYQAISAGVDAAHVTEFLGTVTRASIAGYTDATTAINGVTTVLNSYSMSASEASKITDQMLITQNLGKTTFGELAQSIGSVTPIAKQLNVTTEELFASLASLTKNGIQTPEAITGLRAALNSVIKPSAEASKAAQQLGIDFSAAHLQSVGWAKFMEEVKEKTGGNVEVMGQLFSNTRALTTMLSLTGAGAEDFTKSLAAMSDQAGITERVFLDIAKNDPTRAMKIATNELKNASMDLGEALAPLLLRTSRAIKALAEAIKSLSPEQKELIMNVLQGIVVFGASVAAVGKAVTMYGTLRGSLLKLALDFTNSKGAAGLFHRALLAMPGAAGTVRGMLSGMGETMIAAAARMRGAGNLLRSAPLRFVLALSKVPGALSAVSAAVRGHITSIIAALRAVPGHITRLGASFVRLVLNMRNGLTLLRAAFAANPIGLALLALTVAIGFVITHWRLFEQVIQTVWTHIKGTFSAAVASVSGHLTRLANKFRGVGQKLSALWAAITGDTQAHAGVISVVLNTLGSVFSAVFAVATAVVSTAFNIIADVIGAGLDVFSGVIEFLTGVFTGNWEQAWNGIKDIFTGIIDGIKNIFGDFIDGISGMLDRIIGKANTAKETAASAEEESADGNWTGTTYFPGGVTWMHEQGPEIVKLPTGAQIIPHSESLKQEYRKGAAEASARRGGSVSISIPKLADTIVVREEQDIDDIAKALVYRMKSYAINSMEGALV